MACFFCVGRVLVEVCLYSWGLLWVCVGGARLVFALLSGFFYCVGWSCCFCVNFVVVLFISFCVLLWFVLFDGFYGSVGFLVGIVFFCMFCCFCGVWFGGVFDILWGWVVGIVVGCSFCCVLFLFSLLYFVLFVVFFFIFFVRWLCLGATFCFCVVLCVVERLFIVGVGFG